ncbi:hypothetical protein RIF29_20361 [Crotalaria pallida]|uniref:Sodium/calcium exchanger membrane region domain-containing protein n=1 Tax=Crotalaria pallida TaxID=3830 RepID=A0AAN9I4Z0_CROPI
MSLLNNHIFKFSRPTLACQVLILTPLVVTVKVALFTTTLETSAYELSAPKLPMLQNSKILTSQTINVNFVDLLLHVDLLVSIGHISGISPSILGLMVLAWGNSLGDLMSNLSMALNGGPEGTQIAILGCYAGPIFNTLVGLGLSLLCTTWSEYPNAVVIPRDPYLWETMALLVVGLVWELVVLIRRDMKLDGLLGGGLLVVYFIALSMRLIQTQGSLDS